ncbi:hypothetical protein C8Q80DRAFT_1124088 [Daedaleopsis nitida]|nr:hypothetical protein C8Q80DRAFT_1124088 [Daedaleopsis nitida]
MDTHPGGEGISVLDTDLEVDFAAPTPSDKQSVIARVHAALDDRELCVYTQGVMDLGAPHPGAVAIAVTRTGVEVARRTGCSRPGHRGGGKLSASNEGGRPALRSKHRSLQTRVLWAPKGAGDREESGHSPPHMDSLVSTSQMDVRDTHGNLTVARDSHAMTPKTCKRIGDRRHDPSQQQVHATAEVSASASILLQFIELKVHIAVGFEQAVLDEKVHAEASQQNPHGRVVLGRAQIAQPGRAGECVQLRDGHVADVPLHGFVELHGGQGVQRFSISRLSIPEAYGESDRLPQA